MSTMDIGPQRIKMVEAVRALKTALKCAICQGTFRPNPITTNCDHTFCQECFSSWMLKSTDRKCPVCLTSVQRRSCKPSPEVAEYVNRYLLLAQVFQKTLKAFNVPPEHEFFESQMPSISDSPVPPSPSPSVFVTPFSFSFNPRRKMESKTSINSTDEASALDEIFLADGDLPGPSAKRRKATVSKAKKEKTLSSERRSESTTNASRSSSERTPPSVVAAVASLVQEAVDKEVDFASQQSTQSNKSKTSRSRARSLKTPKKLSTPMPVENMEQLASPLKTPDGKSQRQKGAVVEQSPTSVSKSHAPSKSVTPQKASDVPMFDHKSSDDKNQLEEAAVVEKSQSSVIKSRARSKSVITTQTTAAASISGQKTLDSEHQQAVVDLDKSQQSNKPAAAKRNRRSKSGTPLETSVTPTSAQKTPDDNQQSQESNQSTSKKRKVYWDWVPVPVTTTEPIKPDADIGSTQSSTRRSLRGSARLTSAREPIGGAIRDQTPQLDDAQTSTERTEQLQASASKKHRRSSQKQVLDIAQEDGGVQKIDADLASATEKKTEEQRTPAPKKRPRPAKKKAKDESDQEVTGEILTPASKRRKSRSTTPQTSPNDEARQATKLATVVDPVKASIDEQCQTEAKVVNDAFVQTMAANETVEKPMERVADAEESTANKGKSAAEMATKEAQTDAYPDGFDDASIDSDDSDQQFDRDSRAIMSDTYLSDRVNIRRRLWRMTRANVHRLMATYPGASRVALLFRILPCFNDIINTRETLQQLVAIAQDNIDACSQALERSMINLDLENMPLFEEQPAAANDLSVLGAFDTIEEVRDANPERSLPHSLDATLGVEDGGRMIPDADHRAVAGNDENSRRLGSPPPTARMAPIAASPLTPSRRLLESNDANIPNKDDTKIFTQPLNNVDADDNPDGELLSTQPPPTVSPTQHDEDAAQTRNSPDMFLSQTSLCMTDAKERAEDNDQSAACVQTKSKENTCDERQTNRGQSVDSASVIGETPSTVLNDTSPSVRSQTASSSCTGSEDTEDEEEATEKQANRFDCDNTTVVSDLVGETPTQQLPFDAHCNSMPAEDVAGHKQTSVDAKSSMVILVSKPRQNDVGLLSQFEQLTGGRAVKRWEDDVTHLVMMDADTRQITQRTIKYAVGIAAKVFVVNRMWIEDSVAQGKMLDPLSYEIIGDSVATTYAAEKSRLSPTKLFEGYSFYLPPRFYGEISAGTVERVLRMSGATVVKMETDLPADGIILFGTGTAKVELKGYAEYADNARRYEHAFKNEVLAADFVLDGISDYKIPDDRQQYRVYKDNDGDGYTKTVFIV